MNHHRENVCDVASQPGMHHKLQVVESESLAIQEQAHSKQAVRDNAHLSAQPLMPKCANIRPSNSHS